MNRAAGQRPGVTTADYAEPEHTTEGYGTAPRRAATVTGGGSTVLALEPGETIELDRDPFVVEDVLSRRGAEATIYRVRDGAGRPLVLKLYRGFARTREEPNPEALARVAAIAAPGVLRLHRFGAGARKLRGRFCYEVCDLAEGGDLLAVPPSEFAAFYSPERVRRTVVPQLFDGLRTLQRHRIFHCDLKPQNIFWLDAARTRLTIGDYGSAKTVEEGAARGLAHTELVKGTDFYLAPEQARRIISAKNDYYSFGMVLVHLLCPSLVSREGLGLILRRQLERRPPLGEDDGVPADLAALVGGLTLYDPDARWGEAEVARWIVGEAVEVRFRSDLDPIKVDAHTVLRSVPELCAFLDREPASAAILVDDEVGLGALKGWVARLDGLEAQRRFARMAALLRGRGQAQATHEASREALVRWFDPARPVRVAEASFDVVGAADPVAEATRALRHLDRAVRGQPEAAPRTAAVALVGLECVLRRLADGTLAVKSARSSSSSAAARAQALCARIDAVAGSPSALPGAEALPGGAATGASSAPEPWDGVARWFLGTGPDELLALLHAADPDRGFRGERGERADTLEELGLHLAAHPDALGSPATVREVRHFLARHRQEALAGLPRRELLFALLHRQLRFEVRLVALSVDATHYRLSCDVGRSLHELLRTSGLRGTGLEPTTTREEHTIERARVPLWRRLRRSVAAALLAEALLASLRSRHQLAPEAIDSRCAPELRAELVKALASDERSSTLGRIVLGARLALVISPLLIVGTLALAISGVWPRPAAPPATLSTAPTPPQLPLGAALTPPVAPASGSTASSSRSAATRTTSTRTAATTRNRPIRHKPPPPAPHKPSPAARPARPGAHR